MESTEAEYYNALNVLHKGDYSKLRKTRERFRNWGKAWNEEGGKNINVEEEWQRIQKLGINLTLNTDKNYPPLLREMPFPPFGIYVLGKIHYPHPALAIVGTRTATPFGKELAKTFASKLSEAGFTIISGLAMGIDEMAHRGAIEGNGKTIAVLGTPLNYIYPRQNERLAKEILAKDGAIISEFPIGQEYHPQNFLIRNRIISGLADAVLIIEAPERSGSLATARFALEQNREIFVIPGNINSRNFRGSNTLIKEGAMLVTKPEDILNHFGIKIDPDEKTFPTGDNQQESIILKILNHKGQQLTVEQILKETKIDVNLLNKNLAMLVIKGIIKESNGKYYLP